MTTKEFGFMKVDENTACFEKSIESRGSGVKLSKCAHKTCKLDSSFLAHNGLELSLAKRKAMISTVAGNIGKRDELAGVVTAVNRLVETRQRN